MRVELEERVKDELQLAERAKAAEGAHAAALEDRVKDELQLKAMAERAKVAP